MTTPFGERLKALLSQRGVAFQGRYGRAQILRTEYGSQPHGSQLVRHLKFSPMICRPTTAQGPGAAAEPVSASAVIARTSTSTCTLQVCTVSLSASFL